MKSLLVGLLAAGGWDLAATARVDNVFDRRYAGSVIVNEGNGRFFEPAPERGWVSEARGRLRVLKGRPGRLGRPCAWPGGAPCESTKETSKNNLNN